MNTFCKVLVKLVLLSAEAHVHVPFPTNTVRIHGLVMMLVHFVYGTSECPDKPKL